ncbi:kinesin-related protein 4-like isoform X1 [Hylaeus anthracinus]|uniref:kinesin-related protein 4-like isoform X1 n=1 Tax=Hylaeus anthracinus TaxID=313031 RepID=UPI0023B99A84|nr:kinesin-related protein 4-like isoform X1 [Hylaeus anthracinus]XP_054010191.1 kinesin-related protein 4-like isoform X1 [Hylaeus anthracinus]XP_054010208.1 kinesin-related protein 4-like isoform X1 [Hylaeus anthracinus]XP_054010209.1 kinesin-related protein 4-like isoform X1 [Hylaeus anthracinus]
MSEENEHTSEETDTEMNSRNHTNEQSKSGVSMLNNETEEPMLDDEEMPTYLSLSSPSGREGRSVNNTKEQDRIPMEEDHSRSPYPSDDQGGGSIYVLSSGEESTQPYGEDEDEYADSDDMYEMELENKHRNVILDDEDDEDEDDEEDDERHALREMYNDEDINTEYDQDCFDRASDDFVLNNRLKQHHKERSLSLQDLSFSKDNVLYNKKRHSVNVTHKKLSTPKFQHVESKVKQYIRDIKEQNRKSIEKRIRDQEYISSKHYKDNKNNDTDPLKPMVTTKVIKDYAEKAIKNLQREENEDCNPVYRTTQIGENGDTTKIDIKIIDSQYIHIRKDTEPNKCSDIHHEKRIQSYDEKLEKQNGSVDVKEHRIELQNTSNENVRFNKVDQPSLVNGHQQTPTLFNLRTLSYEEYMDNAFNATQKVLTEQRRKVQENANESETYNEVEMVSAPDTSNTSCSLKIENVESIRSAEEESANINVAKESATVGTNADCTEVILLKAQLSQRDAQFDQLRKAYQKALEENMKMKVEIDIVKKSLAKYENEHKTCKMKVASVQTETTVEPMINPKIITTTGDTSNKVSTSSVASTISSIDHWADSACSPAISIEPPNVTSILNSDDSIVLTDGTPRKLPHPLSRAFITSSRILQTLSNITQNKAKVESPLARNPKKRTNENLTNQPINLDFNSPIQASNSKKRKATDMLGTSTSNQPYKIPHTNNESEKKNNPDAADVEVNYSEVQTNEKTEQSQNRSGYKNIDSSSISMENQVDETNGQDDSVKCFLYREHENSVKRSFLIQAEEPSKDKSDDEKNHIQECGPYLLGNLEVRMSEINGTISVWGKEIGDESVSDNEDDIEVSMKSTENKLCSCWQKSPQTRFNGNSIVCSTNKKSKNPFKFNRSQVSQCHYSLSPSTAKSHVLVNDANDKKYASSPFTPNACTYSCGEYDSTKQRKECQTCKSTIRSQEKLHSCSAHHTEFLEKECHCGSYHETRTRNDCPNHSKDKCHRIKGIRRNSCKSTFTPDSNGHLDENITNTSTEINEVFCKYNKMCRNSPQNITDNNPQPPNCCNTLTSTSYTRKSSLNNTHDHDSSEGQTCSHSPSHEGEDDLLIPHKRSNETPETRQRRLSGRKVRGILMDLLRGCGDCRSTSDNGANKSSFQHKGSSSYIPNVPQIKISPCTLEPACSSSKQCNDKCCHAYARRIESQLEEFRMEMERVRSRSDAILDMLNMLHSVDTN